MLLVNFLTGSSEMLMADAVSKLAAKTPGKEAVAMESFAKALRTVSSLYLRLKRFLSLLQIWIER